MRRAGKKEPAASGDDFFVFSAEGRHHATQGLVSKVAAVHCVLSETRISVHSPIQFEIGGRFFLRRLYNGKNVALIWSFQMRE